MKVEGYSISLEIFLPSGAAVNTPVTTMHIVG